MVMVIKSGKMLIIMTVIKDEQNNKCCNAYEMKSSYQFEDTTPRETLPSPQSVASPVTSLRVQHQEILYHTV